MKTHKIENNIELSVKRFCLPLVLDFKCPHCGANVEFDFEWHYFSYPTLNSTEKFGGECDACGKDYEFDAILRVSIDVDETLRNG